MEIHENIMLPLKKYILIKTRKVLCYNISGTNLHKQNLNYQLACVNMFDK